jgi:hypothetical protein
VARDAAGGVGGVGPDTDGLTGLHLRVDGDGGAQQLRTLVRVSHVPLHCFGPTTGPLPTKK